MKNDNFGDFPKNRARDFQSPCKSIGTPLATFLTLFWTLGRLRRPRAPIPSPLELLALLPASIDQPPRIGLIYWYISQKPLIFICQTLLLRTLQSYAVRTSYFSRLNFFRAEPYLTNLSEHNSILAPIDKHPCPLKSHFAR